MKPEIYTQKERLAYEQIEKLKSDLLIARIEADNSPPPERKRPATPEDIRVGAVIWHVMDREDGGDYWHIIKEVQYPDDLFKAYIADDGCRYGLDRAYVAIEV